MMTETTTSSSSSAVESARLEAVTHLSLSPEEPTELDKAQREAIAQMVRQARDAGIALTGPDGLLRALTAQVVEAALDEELNEHLGYGQAPGRGGGECGFGWRQMDILGARLRGEWLNGPAATICPGHHRRHSSFKDEGVG